MPNVNFRSTLRNDPFTQKSLTLASTQYGNTSCETSADGRPARLPRIVTMRSLLDWVSAPYSAATDSTLAAGPFATMLVEPDAVDVAPACRSPRLLSNRRTTLRNADSLPRNSTKH